MDEKPFLPEADAWYIPEFLPRSDADARLDEFLGFPWKRGHFRTPDIPARNE